MTILRLKNQIIGFPALDTPQAIGDGDPAYGGRFVIDPNDTATVKLLDDAMKEVAKAKWKEDGDSVLAMLIDDKKVAFEHRPYIQKKTGKTYGGFEGKFNLGTRTPINKPRPSVFNKAGEALIADGKLLSTPAEVARLIYSGCRVHAKVEFWAQDNQFGRRINCTLLGVQFAGDGERFGGGSAPASADDFADLVDDGGEDLL